MRKPRQWRLSRCQGCCRTPPAVPPIRPAAVHGVLHAAPPPRWQTNPRHLSPYASSVLVALQQPVEVHASCFLFIIVGGYSSPVPVRCATKFAQFAWA